MIYIILLVFKQIIRRLIISVSSSAQRIDTDRGDSQNSNSLNITHKNRICFTPLTLFFHRQELQAPSSPKQSMRSNRPSSSTARFAKIYLDSPWSKSIVTTAQIAHRYSQQEHGLTEVKLLQYRFPRRAVTCFNSTQ